ncbi:cobyric acid synthase [Xylanibacillus composti]|nr:cobyric acid synthase [Xylanibacillus composti]
MIQGTHSDAGKSVLVAGLCRVFARRGVRTAPFKSQNMALNSYITADGKEIGRAQGVQAEAAGIEATTDMNPILIKPSGSMQSQIVVHGRPLANMRAGEYREQFFEEGLRIVTEAYERLASQFERIVIEGAGSPAEINLNDRELVNMRIARMARAPVLLVGDIDRGGVFASLVGTLQLLEPEDRERIAGFIINKFRGDLRLLEPGLEWLEHYTGKPVLGVVPYVEGLHIESEDSMALAQYSRSPNFDKPIQIAVIRLPSISNFTDLDPLMEEPDCHVRLVETASQLGDPDAIVLPGSKNTLGDLRFLQESGLFAAVERSRAIQEPWIVGICGGFQMMGRSVQDEERVESPEGSRIGFGWFPMDTVWRREKVTVRVEGAAQFAREKYVIHGYEIHHGWTHYEQGQPFSVLTRMGSSEEVRDGMLDEHRKLMGTYVHGVFHNDAFRAAWLNGIRARKGLAPLKDRPNSELLREEAYDRLADVLEQQLDMERIERILTDAASNG